MQMQRCPQGHYYDAEKAAGCPECARMAVGLTMPVRRPAAPEADSGQTQPLIKKKLGADPVVGWLVCVEGADKGQDYRIHAENNYIGRSEAMDICIAGDDAISRENHAVISYDPEEDAFYFAPVGGRGIVRLGGKAVLTTTELKAYDRIGLGATSLLFVPFCGEAFRWL